MDKVTNEVLGALLEIWENTRVYGGEDSFQEFMYQVERYLTNQKEPKTPDLERGGE